LSSKPESAYVNIAPTVLICEVTAAVPAFYFKSISLPLVVAQFKLICEDRYRAGHKVGRRIRRWRPEILTAAPPTVSKYSSLIHEALQTVEHWPCPCHGFRPAVYPQLIVDPEPHPVSTESRERYVAAPRLTVRVHLTK